MKKQNPTKRNLFAGLMEAVNATKTRREGKVTLHTIPQQLPYQG